MLNYIFFYCYLALLIKNVVASEGPPRVYRVAKDNITLVAFLQKIPIMLASEMCSGIGSEVTNRLSVKLAIDFFNNLHEDYEKFWLGASFKNGTWVWNDGVHVKLKNFSPKDSKNDNETCLIYNRFNGNIEEADCSDSYSTVCNRKDGENLGKLLFLLIQNYVASLLRVRLLFVIDNDITVGLKYQSILNLVKNLANTVVLNKKRSFGIEWYSLDASYINFAKNSSNCLVRMHLDELFKSKLSTTNTLAIYSNAFKIIVEEMEEMINADGTLFVFFFAMRPDSGSVEERNKFIEKLNSLGVVIIVIAWSDDIVLSRLEDVASTIDDQLLLYSIDSMSTFSKCSEYLRTKRKFIWNDCSQVGRRSRSLKISSRFRCY